MKEIKKYIYNVEMYIKTKEEKCHSERAKTLGNSSKVTDSNEVLLQCEQVP